MFIRTGILKLNKQHLVAWHRFCGARLFLCSDEVKKMNDTRKKIRTGRIQNPFDDGAEERLRRMGLLHGDGEINTSSLMVLSSVYAGLLFDELCDFYQDYSMVQDDLNQLFTAAETADARQRFLLICLQYDGLGQALPNPIWWISGTPALAADFADGYIRHLKQLCYSEEVP